MVEDAIEEDADTLLHAGVHQPLQVLLGAEPAVDAQVVDGVVAVRLRLEDGAQGEAVAAQREQVRQPRLELPQPRHGGCAFRKRRPLGSGEAQRVDLPPDGVPDPVAHSLPMPSWSASDTVLPCWNSVYGLRAALTATGIGVTGTTSSWSHHGGRRRARRSPARGTGRSWRRSAVSRPSTGSWPRATPSPTNGARRPRRTIFERERRPAVAEAPFHV